MNLTYHTRSIGCEVCLAKSVWTLYQYYSWLIFAVYFHSRVIPHICPHNGGNSRGFFLPRHIFTVSLSGDTETMQSRIRRTAMTSTKHSNAGDHTHRGFRKTHERVPTFTEITMSDSSWSQKDQTQRKPWSTTRDSRVSQPQSNYKIFCDSRGKPQSIGCEVCFRTNVV